MTFLVVLRWIRILLVTIWFWLGASIATLLLGLVVILFGARDHDLITALIEQIMAGFIHLWMTIPGIWTFKVMKIAGLNEDLIDETKGPFLLAANHNSIIDTLFMALLPHHKSYTFNAKWSWVPIFGQLCVKAGYVSIDTSNVEKKAQVVPNIISMMKNNYSIMIYPQGTRSQTPEDPILPSQLKHGTFTIASKGDFKILPIAIKGSHKAMMRGGWCDVATVEMILCEPFNCHDVEEGRGTFCRAINEALSAKEKTH